MSSNISLLLVTEKPVLVTGAAGWLASHIVYQLLDKGYKVRGTIRKEYDFLRTFHPKAAENLELVKADLMCEDGWNEAVAGVEYILHVASPFTFNFKNEEELIKPAVSGVNFLYKAALSDECTVKRIVQTSSIVAVMGGHPKERYDGSKKFNQEDWSVIENISGYDKSKTMAERRAWELVKEYNSKVENVSSSDVPSSSPSTKKKVELCAINPGFIIGPVLAKHHETTESTTHMLRVMNRAYPAVPNIWCEHVDVRDVARAEILAMEALEVDGKRFLVTAEYLSFADQGKICAELFSKYGYRPATKTIPDFVIHMGKHVSKDLAIAADKVGKNLRCDSEMTMRCLGIKEWRPLKDAFYGHSITMMKSGLLDKKNTPQDIVDKYNCY